MSTSDNTKNTTKESNQVAPEANKKQSPKSQNSDLNGIYVGIAFVVLLWIFYPFLLNLADNSKPEQPQIIIPYQIDAMLKTEPEQSETIDEEKTKFQQIGDTYGTYGDSYGSLNTLFSGLAFTFLVASLFLQRKELHAQRLEIEDQKDEIRKSNIIADKQREIAASQEILISNQLSEGQKQNFYNLLFKFLDEKNNRFSRLIIRGKHPNEGDEFMKAFSESLSDSIKEAFAPDFEPERVKKQNKNFIEQQYLNNVRYYGKSFEDYSYFEYFVSILDFIKKNYLYNQDESVTQIFLSTLTKHETICMAYYAVLKNQTLYEYIEEFSLLRNLDSFKMVGASKQNLKSLYDEQAFIPPKKATLDDFIFVDSK